MTARKWIQCLARLDELERYIYTLEPESPNPSAARCIQSRHRTLAHLRACQELWVDACFVFKQQPGARLKILHPWRAFKLQRYDLLPWEDHMYAFRADRKRLNELLKTSDPSAGGAINEVEYTIEKLVHRIVSHEDQHLFRPK